MVTRISWLIFDKPMVLFMPGPTLNTSEDLNKDTKEKSQFFFSHAALADQTYQSLSNDRTKLKPLGPATAT